MAAAKSTVTAFLGSLALLLACAGRDTGARDQVPNVDDWDEVDWREEIEAGVRRRSAPTPTRERSGVDRRPAPTPVRKRSGVHHPHIPWPDERPLPRAVADALLESDWLFQADHRPTPDRSLQEIGWACELADRLAAHRRRPDFSAELAQLDALRARARSP